MLEGFELLGRVWNGSVVRGGLAANATEPPLLHTPPGLRWQHQQVLVLRRADADSDEAAKVRWRDADVSAEVRRLRDKLGFDALRRTSLRL